MIVSSGVQTAAKFTSYLVRRAMLKSSHWTSTHSTQCSTLNMLTAPESLCSYDGAPSHVAMLTTWRIRCGTPTVRKRPNSSGTHQHCFQVIGIGAFAGVLSVAAAGVQTSSGSAAGFSPRGACCTATIMPWL